MAITERYVTSGAAGGGAGTEGDPWTLAEAITSAVAGDRVNIKADGTYTQASPWTQVNAGTDQSPIIWRGYKTTIGDGYQGRNADGTLNTTNMPTITRSGNGSTLVGNTFSYFDSLNLTYSGGGNTYVLYLRSGGMAVNCRVYTSGAGGTSNDGITTLNYCHVTNCDVIMDSTLGYSAISTASCVSVIGCRITCADGYGIFANGDCGAYIGNLIYNCGDDGIYGNNAGKRFLARHNTIVGNTGSGITVNSHTAYGIVLTENLITDNGGYGYEDNVSGGTYRVMYGNRFDRNTSGVILNQGDVPMFKNNTASVTQANEYTDAASDDYSLAASSPAKGLGRLGANVGYWQNAVAAGGGGGGDCKKYSCRLGLGLRMS